MDEPTTCTARAPLTVGAAAFAGWLPVIVVNAVFVQRVEVDIGAADRALHHFYDAGQLLGLAVASWVAALSLWRLPLALRVGAFAVLVAFAHYALLGDDLESFLERHEGSQVPWHPVFAGASTVGLLATWVGSLWLSRRALWPLGIAAGLVIAIANHLVLELDYPGTHFILAWVAATLIGGCAVERVAGLRRSRWQLAVIAISGAASAGSYLVVPPMSVRSALLSSSGAVAAPYVARAWTVDQAGPTQQLDRATDAWFSTRADAPAVPPEPLNGVPPNPIVILLTVDALRADVLDPGAKGQRPLPNFRAMSKASLHFTRAWAPAPYTMASLRSMFYGAYYLQQPGKKAREFRKQEGQRPKVLPRQPLARLLEQHGVATVNLSTHKFLRGKGSVCRGFGEEKYIGGKAPSKKVVSKVLRRVSRERKGPLFVYSHIMDPHAPYDLGGKEGSKKDRYLAEVALVDKAIGKLRRGLRKRGLHDETFVFVTSDHGEAFGEHGRYHHGSTVYEEMIRVPLLIEGPGVKRRRVDTPITLLDVGPTILSLFGAHTPGSFMGQSLVPFMRGEDPVLTRPVAVDGGRGIRAMLFEGRWKAVVHVEQGTEEVYDLEKDPQERRNLADQTGSRPYLTTLRAFFSSLNDKAEVTAR